MNVYLNTLYLMEHCYVMEFVDAFEKIIYFK